MKAQFLSHLCSKSPACFSRSSRLELKFRNGTEECLFESWAWMADLIVISDMTRRTIKEAWRLDQILRWSPTTLSGSSRPGFLLPKMGWVYGRMSFVWEVALIFKKKSQFRARWGDQAMDHWEKHTLPSCIHHLICTSHKWYKSRSNTNSVE